MSYTARGSVTVGVSSLRFDDALTKAESVLDKLREGRQERSTNRREEISYQRSAKQQPAPESKYKKDDTTYEQQRLQEEWAKQQRELREDQDRITRDLEAKRQARLKEIAEKYAEEKRQRQVQFLEEKARKEEERKNLIRKE